MVPMNICRALLVLALLLPATAPLCAADEPAAAERTIDHLWEQAQRSLAEDKLREFVDLAAEIEKQKELSNLSSLEEISLALIGAAEQRYHLRDRDAAQLLLRRALKFSPESARVLFRSLWISRATGESPVIHQLLRAARGLWYNPAHFLALLSALVYPLLWACTLGLYAALVLFFCYRIQTALRRIARRMSVKYRGFLAPLAVITLVVIPTVLSPLWAIVALAVLSSLLLKERQWAPLAAGCLLLLWGMLIPARENISQWLDDPATNVLVAALVGDHGKGAASAAYLEGLVRRTPDDAVAWYALGQAYMRNAQYDEAQRAFKTSARYLGEQPWTTAQLGTIQFVQGNAQEADNLYASAGDLGLSSAAFWFNYSKIKFEETDTITSREYSNRARAADEEAAQRYQEIEERRSGDNRSYFVDIRLPAYKLFSAAFRADESSSERQTMIAAAIMSGITSPYAIIAVGLALLFLGALQGREERRVRELGYYVDYYPSRLFINAVKLLPGGAWIIAGRPFFAALLLAGTVALILPVLGWPQDIEISPEGGFLHYYYAACTLWIVGIVATGLYLREDA